MALWYTICTLFSHMYCKQLWLKAMYHSLNVCAKQDCQPVLEAAMFDSQGNTISDMAVHSPGNHYTLRHQ